MERDGPGSAAWVRGWPCPSWPPPGPRARARVPQCPCDRPSRGDGPTRHMPREVALTSPAEWNGRPARSTPGDTPVTRRWPRLPAPPLSPGRTRQGHRGRRPGPPARFPSPALAPIRALPPAGAARTPEVGGRRSKVGGPRLRKRAGAAGRAPGKRPWAAPAGGPASRRPWEGRAEVARGPVPSQGRATFSRRTRWGRQAVPGRRLSCPRAPVWSVSRPPENAVAAGTNTELAAA